MPHSPILVSLRRAIQRVNPRAAGRVTVPQPRESGQSLVVIAVALIGLVAFAGLVFDGGNAYAQRRRMQNAADAGAMAGARELADGSANCVVTGAIDDYTRTKNGALTYEATYVHMSGLEVPIPNDCGVPAADIYAVRVTAHTSFPTLFLGMFGNTQGGVAAEAAAAFGGVNNLRNNVTPIAPECFGNANSIENCGYSVNHSYGIWDGGGFGNLGWLGWGNSGSNSSDRSEVTLCENLQNPGNMGYTNPNDPNDHSLSIGDWVAGTTGVKNSSCDRDVLQTLMITGQPVTLIFWGTTQGSGSNLQYQIVGFGKFVIEAFRLSHGNGSIVSTPAPTQCNDPLNQRSNSSCIQGRFLEWVDPGDIEYGRNQGLMTIKLVSIPPPIPTPGIPPGGTPRPPTVTYTPAPSNTAAVVGPSNTPAAGNTPTNTPVLSGRLCAVVFNDLNKNGKQQPGDPMIAGAQIRAVNSGGVVVASGATDSSGSVCFSGLAVGTYAVTETNLPGMTSSTPDTMGVMVTNGGMATVTFGDYGTVPTLTLTPRPTNTILATPTATSTNTPTSTATPTPVPGVICVSVFNDLNGNGMHDGGEPMLAAAAVSVKDPNGTVIGSWTSGLSGAYCFTGLVPGTYIVGEVNPPGYPTSVTPDILGVVVAQNATTLVEFGDQAAVSTPTVTSTPPTGTPTLTGTPPTSTPTATSTPTLTGTPATSTPTPTGTPTVTGTPPTRTPTATSTPTGTLTPFPCAIAVDRTSVSAASGATTLTWSHTIGNGKYPVLVVGVSALNAGTAVSGVTYGGASLTRLGLFANPNATRVELWYLAAPAAGSANVQVTMAGANNVVAGAISLTGVNQTTPFRAGSFTAGSGSGKNDSLTVTSAAGEMVLDLVATQASSGAATAGAGQAQAWQAFTGSLPTDVLGAFSTESGAPSASMSWQWPNTAEWTHAGASLQPATCP